MGAGSSIGRAVVLRLVEEGTFVLGIDLNETGLKETIQLSSYPERISFTIISVTDEEKSSKKLMNMLLVKVVLTFF
jgi:nucleoside-diphosphate-sugar epimerase